MIRALTILLFAVIAACAAPGPVAPVSETVPGKPYSTCGGAGALTCPAGQYCALSACGSAPGSAGACAAIPTVCTREYRPVCGCNGKTYPNPCGARADGVNVAGPGACKA